MSQIEHDISTSATATRAYEAVSTKAGIESWWCKKVTLGSAVGDGVRLDFVKNGQPVTMEFRIDDLTPGERVVWSCTANPNPAWIGTKIEWSVRASDRGATVRLVHSGFTMDGPPLDMTRDGWNHFAKSLGAVLDGGAGEPW